MNHSVNAQRPASSQHPVTPPRRITPQNTQLSLLHDTHRRHHIPVLRPQHDASALAAQSLAQANARVVHERLQQNHNRVQVQLHPRPSPLPPSAPVKPLFDTTFRAYALRIQTEFNNLRAACMRVVQREQDHAAEMREVCARLAHERDAAEEKLRVLLDRRACARKRTYAELENAYQDAGGPSTASPPSMPTQSPPPRLLSPFVLAVHRSPSHTPDPADTTEFDLTVSCESLPRPAKRRRVSNSSETTLVPSLRSTPLPEGRSTPTKERETHPPAGCGECDMDLASDSESSDAESDFHSAKSKSRASSRAASCSPAAVESSTQSLSPPPASPSHIQLQAPVATSSSARLKPDSSPPPWRRPHKAHLDLQHVDIMYLPTNGKLVCRVCLLVTKGSATETRTGAVQAFLPGSSWEMLRSHCEEEHPEACRDVVGLGEAGVRELRRRLGLRTVGRP
ncbi:hypothetical protein GGX14DRAFT_574475 [Mycena pura]|uniref:Uncharacterized protein n=1 Tax=Mycena pura TaxID=153505 RepID=A0AAD6Y916_9AGAR|nr:hypothetical protein GGX14DRAFT_574475 [Mycena pura]